MKTNFEQLAALVAATMFVTSMGCSTLNPNQKSPGQADNSKGKSLLDQMPWRKQDADAEPYPNPAKIATTWTPDTLVQTGRTPTRGFGGRVFFYDEKSRAVPVNGTLIVHGFDDAADSQQARVKRFEFTPEQFTRHFSQTDLGASYSIWIPWDAIGGEQKRVSLVTSFRTGDGKLVQGVPATVLLPGASTESSIDVKITRLSPQYNRYLQAMRAGGSNSTGLTTTTIARRTTPAKSDHERTPENSTDQNSAPADLVVSAQQTPSAEISMTRKTPKPTILPASAQVPIDQTRCSDPCLAPHPEQHRP